MILIKLPNRELFLGQQVCRKWRDIIKRSRDIQCALGFQRSEEMKDLAIRCARNVFSIMLHPAKLVHFAAATDYLVLQYPYGYFVNPVVESFLSITSDFILGCSCFDFKMECLREGLKLDGTSADRMYLTFPPTMILELRTETDLINDVGETLFSGPFRVDRESGVTVGDLFQNVVSLIGRAKSIINQPRLVYLPIDTKKLEYLPYKE